MSDLATKHKGLVSAFVFCALIGVMCTSARGQGDAHSAIRDALGAMEAEGKWPADIEPLSQLLTIGNPESRREACFVVAEHLVRHEDQASGRQLLVKELCRSLLDPAFEVRSAVARWLIDARSGDFDAESRMSITSAFTIAPTSDLYLLGGLAGCESIIEQASKIGFDPTTKPVVGKFYGTIEWSAALVNARRGDETSVSNVIRAIEGEPDPVTRVSLLLVQVAYVQQPKAVELLKSYLDSEDRLEAIKSTAPGAKHAQYAAIALSKMLTGFPVNRSDPNYTDEELETCRTWMSKQVTWTFRQ